jgi:glucose 1-dehydrogenase
MQEQPLKHQTCVVTGASSGIGQAIAIAMAEAGANVVINYHSDEQGAQSTVDTIQQIKQAGTTLTFQADVSNEEQVEEMFAEAIRHFGTIDILVANAGIQQDAPFHEMTSEQWQKVIDVNLTGLFYCTRAAIQEFLRRGERQDISKAVGKVIFMSSVHEAIPWSGHANYAASKGGLDMLMQSLAQGYGKHKIRVNSIAPGAIKTDINKSVWSDEKKNENLLKLIPYGRIGEVEEIGKAAVWLASDASDYITGTSLFIDGGMTTYPGFIDNG